MRIALVTAGFPEISETFIYRQASALGADVLATGVNLKQVTTDFAGNIIGISNGKELRGSVLQRACARVRRRLFGDPAPSWPVWVQANVDRYVSEHQPDVALVHFLQNALRCHNICNRHALPMVIHANGMDVYRLPNNRRFRSALGPLFEEAAAVVAVSHPMVCRLRQLGCPSEKIRQICYGIPTAQFLVSRRVSEQPCRFLAVGRFVDKKAPICTLEAFHSCVKANPSVRLEMIGDGPQLQAARRYVKARSLDAWVTLHGARSNEFVCERMNHAQCFVQHSRTATDGDTEGWPVAIAEAAASGLPVIATRHAGIPEQVIDGQTGFLVNEGDIAAMGARMIEMADDPQRRVVMGQAGRRHVEEVGDFTTQVAKLREVLTQASSKRKSAFVST